MSYNSERTGFWESLRDVPSRMSLRLKLITALLVLVGLALAVTTLVGNAILKNYLLSPYDTNLSAIQAQDAQSLVASYLNGAGTRPFPGTAVDFISGSKTYQIVQPTNSFSGSNGSFGFRPAQEPGPTLETSPSWLVT